MAEAEAPIVVLEAAEEAAAIPEELGLAEAEFAETGNGVDAVDELVKGAKGSAWNTGYQMLDKATGGGLNTAVDMMDWFGDNVMPYITGQTMDDAVTNIERYVGYGDPSSGKELIPFEANTDVGTRALVQQNELTDIDGLFNDISNYYDKKRKNPWAEEIERYAKRWMKDKANKFIESGKRKGKELVSEGAKKIKTKLIETAQQMIAERKAEAQRKRGYTNLLDTRQAKRPKLTHPRHGRRHRLNLHKYFLGKRRTQNWRKYVY